ncbi:MAG: chemotaxis protein CheW [Thermoanaerobaculia bacterium]
MDATLMREALVVVIAGESRTMPMERVVQVRVHHGTIRIPGAPEWVRGFVDLDGRPVEVLDAARRLGCGELRLDARSCVIFLETGSTCTGMLVDAVQGIVAEEGTIPAIDLDAFFGLEGDA